MALYIPHSIFHLAWLLYVRPENFGPYYVSLKLRNFKLRNSGSICIYSGTVLGRTRQTREILNQEAHSLCRDLKPGPSKYEATHCSPESD